MNIASAQLLNSSIANAGNAFGQARQFDIETQLRQQQLDEQRRRDDIEQTFRDRQLVDSQRRADAEAKRLEKATAPQASWKSKGMTIHAPMNEELPAMLQQHPADPEDDGTVAMSLSGADENGVEAHMTFKAPQNASQDPNAHAKVADAMQQFRTQFGHAPRSGAAKPGAVNLMVQDWHKAQQEADAATDPVEKASLKAYADALFSNLPAEVKKTPAGVTPTESTHISIKPDSLTGKPSTNTITTIKRPLPVAPALKAQPESTTEVRRVTNDGRTAVFDATTKQFLRYE